MIFWLIWCAMCILLGASVGTALVQRRQIVRLRDALYMKRQHLGVFDVTFDTGPLNVTADDEVRVEPRGKIVTIKSSVATTLRITA